MVVARSNTVILVDPDVSRVGVDLDGLLNSLRGLGTGRTAVVPGLARHPELLAGTVKKCGARTAVVVSAECERPPIPELRMWGEAGGLAPLGVQVVALDILRSRRSPAERAAYAVRMVGAAVAAVDTSGTGRAARRPIGATLSRRALLSRRATTWVPVVEVDPLACSAMPRCARCVEACPQDALQIEGDAPGATPVVDASRCQACSWCLDVCPTGALSLNGHDPGTLAQQLFALLRAGDGAGAPALVISCQSASEPLHHLGERAGLPGWLALELPCLGGVGSTWHLAALAAGARAVQVLPCERCMDRASLTRDLGFTRRLLTALGDVEAARRVGLLPPTGPRLRRALLAAEDLTALVDGTKVDRTQPAGAFAASARAATSARVAAWAVETLRVALGSDGTGQHLRPQMIQGEASPLGVPHVSAGCTACGVCVRSCPTLALSLNAGVGSTELVLDPAACTRCAVCVPTCPEGVLEVVPGVDLDLLASGCVPIARVETAACADCGESVPALPVAALQTSLPAGLARLCPRCRQAALLASI